MTTKLILILLVAGLFTKAHGDNFDEALKTLLKFATTVDDVVLKTEQVLNETLEDISNTAEAIKSISRRLILSIEHGLTSEMDALWAVAQAAGVDAYLCVQNAKRGIYMMTQSTTNSIGWCITARQKETAPLFDEIFSNLDNARESVRDFQRRIEECRAADDQICLTVVVTQIEAQNTLLPILLENDVQEVRGVVVDAELYYQDCATGSVEDYQLRGNSYLGNVKRCTGVE